MTCALLLAGIFTLGLAPAASAQEDAMSDLDAFEIPYEKFVLDNGLTLIVHEDHKAPIVAVNVWYHVGSKNEPDGKSGFAHLFEHLMFNGTENYDDEYFGPLEQAGATDMNGTTNEDRTNYFQNVPKNALDLALWLESDRMGHLLGAVTQEKLDEQRGVVQNEKRQGENQPYGKVYNLITEATWPEGHPYAHTVIGSMEDLDAASREDVQNWFRTYYGPNNAVVVLAGDITPEEALEKVNAHFGDIPASPPIAKFQGWTAKRTGTQRQVLQDRVPQARIYKVWNVPEWGSAAGDHLELAADVLAEGKTSRLYRRLVYEEQIATDVAAYADLSEIAGQFVVRVTARPDADLARVEAVLDEEFGHFLDEGPTAEELQRVKTQMQADFLRGIERIGGFGGKSDILAESQVYGGSPDAYLASVERALQATPEDVHETARAWLSDGVYILEVHPYPELLARNEGVDRSRVPDAGTPPEASFPELQRATLSNGLQVILAERHTLPLVDMTLLLDAGYAADQHAAPGTASLALNMLDEGTTSRSSLEISEALDNLGADLNTGSDLDVSEVSMTALKENLDASLDLFADVILNPSFPEREFSRLQQEQLARIQREKATPVAMALRVFPQLLYGEGHAYANPLTGSGTEASVTAMTREDLTRFHETWFKSNNATLVVVGDVTMEELEPKLEARFSGWQEGAVPTKNIATVDDPEQPAVYLLDRPGSEQSIIFAGHVAPPKDNPQEFAIESMNNVLGGTFTSRVNMNLREDKGWAYGAFTFIQDAKGQRPFIAYAPVQTDKTKESIQELMKELTDVTGERPVTDEELQKTKNEQTLTLPGRWETISSVSNDISDLVSYGLPDDYYTTYAEQVRALTLQDVNDAARATVRPDNMVWVVVGDRERIEPEIRSLGLGEVHLIDSDGREVAASE